MVRLYVDGTEVHVGAITYEPTTETADLWIGHSVDGEYWNGTLDDIRIYRRVLNATEVAGLASAGGGGGPPAGGVLFEEFTEASLGSNGTSLTISKPASTAAGDLLIAAVATDGNTTSSLNPPADWNVINVADHSGSVTFGVWWKLAGTSESSSYTFNWSNGEEAYGWIMRFTGHDTLNPINVSANAGGTSDAPTSPAVTSTVANTMILRVGGFDDDDISGGDPNPGLSDHTAITMGDSGSGNRTSSGGAGYVTQASTGDSGTSSFLLTNSEEFRTVTIAIAPAP